MAKFRFETVYEKAWFCDIEAETFEEAKEMMKDSNNISWEEDDGGESYLTNSYAQKLDTDDDVIDEYEWQPGD